jgi:outer membrane lipoprotein-sorting protein
MKYFILIGLFFISFGLKAQKIYDKEAEALLERISEKIKANRQVEAQFTFSIDYPGAEKDVKKGELNQNADSYHVSIGDNEIISSSEGFYLVDKISKSVQINDPLKENSTDLYNPISLMEKYDSGEFEYAITGEDKIDDKRCYLVEFKPVDRYSELSKIRIAISMNDELPVYIKIFNKDASRVEIEISELMLILEKGSEIDFDKLNYTEYIIEDLRID